MITISEVHDLKEAERLWRALSPQETIFDEWDFRYCFYKYNPYPLCFLVAFDKGEVVGLLPLQLHPKHGYEFFAEDPCEENRPFIKSGYEKIIVDLYTAVPGAAKCYDITGTDKFTVSLPLEDYKYVLPLAGLKNFSDFLTARLSAKRRRSLAKEIASISASGVKVIKSSGGQAVTHLEDLFIFNNNNFAGESYLKSEEQGPWRDLLQLAYDWRMITLQIGGINQGISLSVFYGGEWHYLVTGVNFKEYPSLGKYLVKVNIGEALAAKAKIFDAGLGDCGWKHLWHFDKRPQHEFEKSASGRIRLHKV